MNGDLLQRLPRPLIAQNRYIVDILRFAVVNQKEATSVVEGKLVIIRGPAEFRRFKIAIPVVLAHEVQYES